MKSREESPCRGCGSLRPGDRQGIRGGAVLGVSGIPSSLRGDAVYVHRQTGLDVLNSFKAKARERSDKRVQGRIDQVRHGPGSLQHYRGAR